MWDLETAAVVRGHRVHCTTKPSKNGTANGGEPSAPLDGAICISNDRQILSMDSQRFVSYCLRSNTYTLFKDDFITKRQRVTVLKSSPYAEHILAVGYKGGLIVIADIKSMCWKFYSGILDSKSFFIKKKLLKFFAFFSVAESTILHTLRGHDTDIVSMEWMVLHSSDFAGQTTEIRRATPSNGESSICSPPPPQSPTRSNTSSTSILTSAVLNTSNIETEPLEEQAREETTAEAPQNGSKTDSAEPIDETTAPVLVEVVASDSNEYSPPSESEQVRTDGNEPKDQEETSAIDDSSSLVNDISKKFYLATGAQESFVYIWDTKDGKIAHKINLKNRGKSSIPSKFSYTALI